VLDNLDEYFAQRPGGKPRLSIQIQKLGSPAFEECECMSGGIKATRLEQPIDLERVIVEGFRPFLGNSVITRKQARVCA